MTNLERRHGKGTNEIEPRDEEAEEERQEGGRHGAKLVGPLRLSAIEEALSKRPVG